MSINIEQDNRDYPRDLHRLCIYWSTAVNSSHKRKKGQMVNHILEKVKISHCQNKMDNWDSKTLSPKRLKKKTYHCFVDYTKAFKYLKHARIMNILRDNRCAQTPDYSAEETLQ